jgi:hypothetical protein
MACCSLACLIQLCLGKRKKATEGGMRVCEQVQQTARGVTVQGCGGREEGGRTLLTALLKFVATFLRGPLRGHVRQLWPLTLQSEHVTLVARGCVGHLRLLCPGCLHCEHVTVPLRLIMASAFGHANLLCPMSPQKPHRLRRRSTEPMTAFMERLVVGLIRSLRSVPSSLLR